MVATRQVIVDTTPVDTTQLQTNWSGVTPAPGDIGWQVTNNTIYGAVLEYGGYRRARRKTIQLGGGDLGHGFYAGSGVYSKQAPLGWVRRALSNSWDPWSVRLRNAIQAAWSGQEPRLDVSSLVPGGPSRHTINITRQLLDLGGKMRRSRQRKTQRKKKS
jgi:hypothetical protein